MKKTTLLLITLTINLLAFSQVTHDLNWGLGSSNLELFINEGDTVRWTLTDNINHTVTSISGPTSYNSGTISGIGTQYSVTFNTIGTSEFVCNFHAGMNGRIIIQALGVNDHKKDITHIYPNPATDYLTINASKIITQVTVVNLLGKKLITTYPNSNETKLDISSFPSGLLLIKVNSKESTESYKLFKK